VKPRRKYRAAGDATWLGAGKAALRTLRESGRTLERLRTCDMAPIVSERGLSGMPKSVRALALASARLPEAPGSFTGRLLPTKVQIVKGLPLDELYALGADHVHMLLEGVRVRPTPGRPLLTLFHELGHHLDGYDFHPDHNSREKAADEMAIKWLIARCGSDSRTVRAYLSRMSHRDSVKGYLRRMP